MEKVGNIIRQNVQFSYLCFDITDKMLVVKVAVFVAIHMKRVFKRLVKSSTGSIRRL